MVRCVPILAMLAVWTVGARKCVVPSASHRQAAVCWVCDSEHGIGILGSVTVKEIRMSDTLKLSLEFTRSFVGELWSDAT